MAGEVSSPERIGAGRVENALPADAIRAQLEKILTSMVFAQAERPSRLLRFMVEQALAGQRDSLTEHSLAVDVLGRKPSFDPQSDSIVRTEVSRLRVKLSEYYKAEGHNDPIIIDLPKRSYAPVFRRRIPARPSGLPWLDRAWRPAAVVAALLVGCSLTYWLMRRSTPAAPSRTEIRSIAVLPFSDLSPRKDQEYFCDGMSDELINALTRVPGLGVAARTSSFQFRGQPHDVREIGRKLNVGALVEGSIRKAGNRLRMTVQLVSTADGYHLWSENYDRELGDILAVQEEISQAIVNALRIQLAANQPASLIKRYTDNTEAYLLYLRGRHFANKLTREGFTNAIRYFQQALEKDPTYALAYAGLADSYIFFYWRGVPQKEALAQTEQAVRKALELDDSLAEAHTSLGQLKVYRWDWESARREYRRAIELNPKYWRAHLGMSTELALLGNVDGAITEARRALEIEPLSPWINGNLGWLYYCSRQYDRAVEQLQKAIEVDKEFRMAHTWLAYCHLRTRKHEDAIAEARTSGREDHGIVAEAYALSGRSAEARMLLTKVPGRVPRARVYAALGNSDLALEELERLLQERSATLPWIRPDPAFESLRSDPRFTALLRRIGLEK